MKEKISITSHQGNANQSYDELSLCTCQNGYHQKDNRKLVYCFWEYKLVQPLWKTGFSKI